MKKQQRYTPEFRAEAVKLVFDQGLSQETAAKRLAIPKGTLGNYEEFRGQYIKLFRFLGKPKWDVLKNLTI